MLKSHHWISGCVKKLRIPWSYEAENVDFWVTHATVFIFRKCSCGMFAKISLEPSVPEMYFKSESPFSNTPHPFPPSPIAATQTWPHEANT